MDLRMERLVHALATFRPAGLKGLGAEVPMPQRLPRGRLGRNGVTPGIPYGLGPVVLN
jgi:hypothetical protein